ncbi:hypothetical protein YC2023_059282 [Brassica napus]
MQVRIVAFGKSAGPNMLFSHHWSYQFVAANKIDGYRSLQAIVISEELTTYTNDDIVKENFVKKILNDHWWGNMPYIIDFTRPIYEMIYGMWD